MSLTSAQDFLSRLTTDADFRGDLTNASDVQAKKDIIRDAGYDFTKDELTTALNDTNTSSGTQQHALDAVENVAPDLQTASIWMYYDSSE